MTGHMTLLVRSPWYYILCNSWPVYTQGRGGSSGEGVKAEIVQNISKRELQCGARYVTGWASAVW